MCILYMCVMCMNKYYYKHPYTRDNNPLFSFDVLIIHEHTQKPTTIQGRRWRLLIIRLYFDDCYSCLAIRVQFF